MQAQLTRNSIGSSQRLSGLGTSLVRISFAPPRYYRQNIVTLYSTDDKTEAEVEEVRLSGCAVGQMDG